MVGGGMHGGGVNGRVACMAGGMHGMVTCITGAHAWQVTCGRRHVWQVGGHVWQVGGACVAGWGALNATFTEFLEIQAT